jgi:hypothetical protein
VLPGWRSPLVHLAACDQRHIVADLQTVTFAAWSAISVALQSAGGLVASVADDSRWAKLSSPFFDGALIGEGVHKW